MMKVNKHTVWKEFKLPLAWIGSVVVTAGVLMSALSYQYTGEWLGLVKLFRTLHVVETYYAENVSKEELLNGALEGIVSRLGDKHSLYLDGEQFDEFTSQMTAAYAGIGVYISAADGGALVAGVIDDSPASEAGLQRGDIVTAIDGTPVEGMALEDISKTIRGPVGTSVTLTIRRDGADTDMTFTRRNIHLKTVGGQMIEGTDIGYIRVAMFSEETGAEFSKQYDELKSQGMKKLILDLRNNPGGLVDQATDVASKFVPKNSVIVSYTGSDGNEAQYTATGTDDLIPLAVLINENSASAAEIVAGDVQDLGLGKVIGVRSYGKGTVQGVYPITSDNAVKLTVAKYRTAKGRQIDGTGIEPDIAVQLQPNDTVDHQLEQAIDVLRQ